MHETGESKLLQNRRRAILVVNFQSRQFRDNQDEAANKLRALAESLKNKGVDVFVVRISELNSLQERLQHNDIVIPCGGDGTINSVLGALWQPIASESESQSLAKAKNIGFLPIGNFGNINDISSELYGNASIDEIIENATWETAYGITAAIEHENSELPPKTVRALGYMAVGSVTGQIANSIDQARELPNPKQAIRRAAVRDIIRARRFRDVHTSGQSAAMLEYIALNARMAGLFRPHKQYMFDNEFHLLRIRKRSQAVGTFMLGLLGLARGQTYNQNEMYSIKVAGTNVYLQSDGEGQRLRDGDTVTISNGPAITMAKL